MKKLGFIALVLLSFSGMAVTNNTPTNDAFSQAVFTKAPVTSAVFASIKGNQNKGTISQCEIDCLYQFRSCVQTAQGIFEWIECERTYESCAANCN